MDSISPACSKFGLTISVAKTKIMHYGTDPNPVINIEDKSLEQVDNFTYLGSTVTSNLSLDAEVESRLSKAVIMMARLKDRVWETRKITVTTKIAVYEACVLRSVLYASETWSTYSKHEKQLNNFRMRCLRRILNIKWQDRSSNASIIELSGCCDIYTTLTGTRRRLR